ncbi:MAG: type II CRISPR RNA-guided endonuclease Cas9 [Rikenellaceae bacterium]
MRTVERFFYKEEIELILNKQIELNEKLQDRELYSMAIEELYRSNTAYRNSIANRDFKYLLINDILLYQRPLKSKKSLVDDCPYESRSFVKDGETIIQGVKCIAKSNPLFQEVRLWQFIWGLKIIKIEEDKDVDVTLEFLPNEESIVNLYEWLNDRDSIKQSVLLSTFFKIKKSQPYRWNYVEDREYPCNTTRAIMLANFKKCEESTEILSQNAISKKGVVLDESVEYMLWHLLYSVNDKYEIISALQSFAKRYGLSERFVDTFKKIKPFEATYGAYSEKAIKKLLPLMRVGKYWDVEKIDLQTRGRIEKLINGEYDESIRERIYRNAINLREIEAFRSLPLWLACYVVYDRHSETKEITKWENPAQMQQYISSFKQHSLHNPVVEQVVLESLRVVKDIWVKYGSIDRINIELGRELKQDKKSRERATRNNIEQENTNLRIKAMLMEFLEDKTVEDVRPKSPTQQLILKIYEDGALRSTTDIPDDIAKISRSASPTKSEIIRYKAWLQQRYRSPYTGEMIPLSRLFTKDYEIEHVIPQKLYFDDSFNNKVICEAAVNGLKGARLAMTFIEEEHGKIVDVGYGKSVKIFSVEEYKAFVNSTYAASRQKHSKLLMTEIPDGFISRQLNDTRYISKLMMGLLSNIVRDESEEDIAISTKVLSCNGSITTKLKQEWGLNDIWNRIVTPRFERLNEMTNSSDFGHWTNKEGKIFFQINMPIDKQRGFNKKRIDHRHHSLDALVIASLTHNHVNYLNNISASDKDSSIRYDLKHTLCEKVKQDNNGRYTWRFKKPWPTYTQDVYDTLCSIVVSFKQNTRVLNRTNNRTAYIGESGRKVYKTQEGKNMAIRKSLHKGTVYGLVNLRLKKMVSLKDGIANYENLVDLQLKQSISSMLSEGTTPKSLIKQFKELEYMWFGQNISKVEIYYFTEDTKDPMVATRKTLDQSFDTKKILAITDTGIQNILIEWLSQNGNNSDIAFSAEGLVEMNKRIKELNGGKRHQPILKVRWSEKMGSKFSVGERGNKSTKYVEADKGTNLYFGIYQSNTDELKRSYESIPLNVVIERLKLRLSAVPEVNEAGENLLFSLSPNDLVYVPTEDQIGRPLSLKDIDLDRVYKMVSTSGKDCFFIKMSAAIPIIDKLEFEAKNKMGRAFTGEMIKELCLKLKVDRLGNITQIADKKI